jgi:hypothetical protein
MSLQDTTGDDMAREDGIASDADNEAENDSLANKLSKELSNWRQRRTSGRSKHNEDQSANFKSESARTIKVRGHETLVIRKPKLATKPPITTEHSGK